MVSQGRDQGQIRVIMHVHHKQATKAVACIWGCNDCHSRLGKMKPDMTHDVGNITQRWSADSCHGTLTHVRVACCICGISIVTYLLLQMPSPLVRSKGTTDLRGGAHHSAVQITTQPQPEWTSMAFHEASGEAQDTQPCSGLCLSQAWLPTMA